MPRIIDARHADGIFYPDRIEYEPALIEYISGLSRQEAERVLEEVGYESRHMYLSDLTGFLNEQNFTELPIANGETLPFAEAPLMKGIISAKHNRKVENAS